MTINMITNMIVAERSIVSMVGQADRIHMYIVVINVAAGDLYWGMAKSS